MIKKILHVIKESVIDPDQKYLGSTKDIRGRTEYFIGRNLSYEELLIADGEDPDQKILQKLHLIDCKKYFAVFFEYPRFPKSMRFLHENYPDLKLLVRSHNIELFHKLHYAYAFLKLKNLKYCWRSILTGIYRFKQEYISAKYATTIFCITEWEAKNYWRFFTKFSKIKVLPFFVPKKYEEEIISYSTVKKRNLCTCLMSSSIGPMPLLLDSLKNFTTLVKKLNGDYSNWNFTVTGKVPESFPKLYKRIKFTGNLGSPLPLLAESKSIAILSNLGFGFKTKILEAIMNKCYIMITKKLYDRLPSILKKYCLIIEPNNLDTFRQALKNSQNSFPNENPNEILKINSYNKLDSIFHDK